MYRMHCQMLASGTQGLLVVIQGLDAAGKDGLVRSLVKRLSPTNINITSFKKPTEEEYQHNFLWRVQRALPPLGNIGFFIRSHYEDILVPGIEGYLPEDRVQRRFGYINDFEAVVQEHGIRILKIYLHVSPDEQLERLKERVNMERKFWKHNDRDWKVRDQRETYLQWYEDIFKRCNQPEWNIVAADSNYWKTWAVMNLMVEKMRAMNLSWPPLDSERFKTGEFGTTE